MRHEQTWVAPTAGKTSALLYHLAYRGDWVGRDELWFLFWPDMVEEKARRNLRQLLTGIKRSPFARGLQVEVKRLCWPIRTDVLEFRQALAERHWSLALEHYQGELLEGFRPRGVPEFDSWLAVERQALHRTWREAVLTFAEHLEGSERHAQAGALLARLRQADPLDEEVFRRYLRSLHLSGQQRQAMNAFEGFEELLAHELAGKPEAATLHLVDAIRNGDLQVREVTGDEGASVPPGGRRVSARHNLQAQATPFVGRNQERVQLAGLVTRPDCRLLSLVGPGGIGKTRLAIEVAREQLEAFEQGVFFISFAAVDSPDLMLYTLADALDFTFYGPRDPKEQLLDYLAERQVLLVLDNLEHLLVGVGLIGEVLERAALVTALATSRERLNLHAERVFDLGGLSIPDGSGGTHEASDAVRLFAQCAGRARRDFVVSESNAAAVVRICRLVGGLPLAIELAASWVRALTPERIADELDRGLGVLRANTRDLPERHHSIYAVFDLSWDRLSPGERDAVKRFSACREGFTLEAAEALAGVDPGILADLVDRSFLSATADGRYVQHPLLHRYAQEKLDADPAARADALMKHGRYYLELIREREFPAPAEAGPKTRATEQANVRAAWGWALATKRVEEIEESVAALSQHCGLTAPDAAGLLAEATTSLDEADRGHHVALGRVLIELASLLYNLLRNEEALSLVERGLEFARSTNDHQGLMDGLRILVVVAYRHRGTVTIQNLEEGLALARRYGSAEDPGRFLSALAFAKKRSASDEHVRAFFYAAIAEVREVGDFHSLGNLLSLFGSYLLYNGDPLESRTLLIESVRLARRYGLRKDSFHALPNALVEMARNSLFLNEVERAETLLEEALDHAQSVGSRSAKVSVLLLMGRVAIARGDRERARSSLETSLVATWQGGELPTLLGALGGFAELHASLGHTRKAVAWAAFVLHHPACMKTFQDEARLLLEALRERLPHQEYAEAVALGKALELEEIVAEILDGRGSG